MLHFSVIAVLLLANYSKTSAQTAIDLTRPVAATEGSASSNGGGGAVYTIPVELPPGIAGMAPSVSVTYSSLGIGNGFSGNGWTLSGISMISRSGKNAFHNGISTPVNYTGSNDAFLLDGKRLMVISGSNGANGAVYGTEQEEFSKVESLGGDGNSPLWFKVTTKTGTVMEYGVDNMKMLTNDGTQTMFWLLRRMTDPSGNYMLFDYTINNTSRYFTLDRISYTGNTAASVSPSYKVEFTYTDKADGLNAPAYISGNSLNQPKLLQRIDVKKTNNTVIRGYAFAYEFLRKKYYLNTVTESGSDGSLLNPITFTYGENTTASEVAISSEYGYSTNQNNIGDFDGDGRQDVQTYAYQYNTSSGETWFKWYQIYDYNNGSIGGKYEYHMDTDIPDSDVKIMGDAAHNPFTVFDFDGDGKDDVFLAKFNKNSYTLNGININYSRVSMGLNNNKITEYKKVQYNSLPSSFYGQHTLWKQGGSFFVSGDFDGDSFSDYILILGINGYSNAYKAFLSCPAKNILNEEIANFGVGVNGSTGEFASLAVAEAKAIIPINFDGDARTELLVVRNEGSYVLQVSPVPATSGFLYGCNVLHTTTAVKTDYRIFPGDFNGDGNTDLLVRPSSNNPVTPWNILYSTGKTFNSTVFYDMQRIYLPGDGYSNSHMLSVGDYDNDGKSEIWHSLDLSGGTTSRHLVYFVNGTSSTHEVAEMNQSVNTQASYSIGDFNGDSKPDLLKLRNSGGTFYVRFMLARPFKERNLLVGASNLGHLTTFDYGLLNNMDNSGVYNRTEGDYSYNDFSDPNPYIRPYMVPAPPMYVLTKIGRPNGLGYQSNQYFAYEDAVFHNSGRGFLGYKRTDSRNDMGLVDRAWNLVNLTYSLLIPEVTQTHLYNGGILTRSRFTHSFKQVSTSSYTNRRFFMKTDRVHTKNWLTNEGVEVLNTYDDYGNITRNVANAGPSDDFNLTSVIETATIDNTYGTYGGSAYPAYTTGIVSSKTRTGALVANKTTNYTYKPSGLLETVTDNVGTTIATTATNVYNALGLVTQTSISAPGVATPVTTYTYDPTYRFIIEKKISGTTPSGTVVKKESKTFDERFATPLTETNTAGLVTTYQYDVFGDLIRTDLPNGVVVTTTKSWETTGYARYSFLTQRLDGSAPEKVYKDILGRTIKTEKRGFGNQWLTTVNSFNAYGQLSYTSAPYYPGEPVDYTYYSYDGYGRTVSESNNTNTLQTTYSTTGGTTYTEQVTDGAGKWSSKTMDATGRILSSSDNGAIVSFTYDSYGNQLTAASPNETFVTVEFDNLGRKKSQTDLNSGKTEYTYDALGRLTQQIDANLKIQTMAYDAFGRLTSNTFDQSTTTYTYYSDAVTGKNSDDLTQVIGFNGDVRSYQYDAFRRLSQTSITSGGVSMSKTFTYDANGRLATTTYPAGFLIRNVYDVNDIVTQVKYELGATSKTLFSATAMNSRGIYTNYSTGNGKTKTATWDFNNEKITRLYTSGVQDLNLVYEAYSQNLLSRRDAIRNLNEEFTYDMSDRLTSARVNGTQQFAITYDGIGQGKIRQKTDVGNYNYSATKVHAPVDITKVAGGPDLATVIGNQAVTITYTPFSKVASISEGAYQLTYAYGADQQRLSSELKQNGNLVERRSYWGDIEGRTAGTVSSEIYYITAGNGLNNIIVKENGAINIYYTYSDHLGSIVALTNEAGTVVAEQNFDAWGRKRNPATWTHSGVPAVPGWLFRGFTGHEHLPVFTLINMNSRMYDPVAGMMLSPDNYVSDPFSPSGYNRYSYANGNPLTYIDPSGDDAVVAAVIIGAIVGAYSGAVMANEGQYNPFKWDYQNGRTWGYMAGGAVVGALSGYVGGVIIEAGGAFSNTLAIAMSSFVNSVGTAIYTGGQTDVSISLGAISINLETGVVGYPFKGGNSFMENLGYVFGALANIQDVFTVINLKEAGDLYYRAESGPGIDHARATDTKGGLTADTKIDISVTHVEKTNYKWVNKWLEKHPGKAWEDAPKWLRMADYARDWVTHKSPGEYYGGKAKGLELKLKNVNLKIMKNISDRVQVGKGIFKGGTLYYGTPLFGCQSNVAHALWQVGVFTAPINFHPLVLYGQLLIRQGGIYGAGVLTTGGANH